jgi:hypothetical protein
MSHLLVVAMQFRAAAQTLLLPLLQEIKAAALSQLLNGDLVLPVVG